MYYKVKQSDVSEVKSLTHGIIYHVTDVACKIAIPAVSNCRIFILIYLLFEIHKVFNHYRHRIHSICLIEVNKKYSYDERGLVFHNIRKP